MNAKQIEWRTIPSYENYEVNKWDKDLGVVGMARKFGVHPTTLNSMLKGETWRDESLTAYKEGK